MSARASKDRPAKAVIEKTGERLQKVLAAAGFGSRRQCEELIVAGRVEVDRQVVRELGTRADPQGQEIRVDGVMLRQRKLVYYALHKPKGVVCTAHDPAGRMRVIDMAPPEPRVFPVGRLDMHSEGLILLTNDGELTNGLTHPRNQVEKTYRVLVAGAPTREALAQVRSGVHLAEGFARPKRLQVKSKEKKNTWLEMVLDEGRNREIRRLLARTGHKVLRLKRIAVGSLRLGDLPEGAYRDLRRDEIVSLRRDVVESRRQKRGEAKKPPLARGRKRRRIGVVVTAAAPERGAGKSSRRGATTGGRSKAAQPSKGKTSSAAKGGAAKAGKRSVRKGRRR